MCILILSTAKRHCFFCGAVSGDAARDPAELSPGCLAWGKIWALYLSSVLFWSGFPEQKGRWLPSCHLLVHSFQKFHRSTSTCLVEYQIGSSQAILIVCFLIFWLTHLASSSWEFFTGNPFYSHVLVAALPYSRLLFSTAGSLPSVVSPQGTISLPHFPADFMLIKLANVWNSVEGGICL